MSRSVPFSLLLILLSAGCTVTGGQVLEPSIDPSIRPGQDMSDEVQPHRQCVPARVTESVIQLHRVVVTLDVGMADGVKVGTSGVFTTGRALKVISVDVASCRAVVTGLNLRIALGAEACLYVDDR